MAEFKRISDKVLAEKIAKSEKLCTELKELSVSELQEREERFSDKIIELCCIVEVLIKSINGVKAYSDCTNPKEIISSHASQIRRSSTSIGANYAEATSVNTDGYFRSKINIAKCECKETIFWLKLIHAKCTLDLSEEEYSEILKQFKGIYNVLESFEIYANKDLDKTVPTANGKMLGKF